MSPEKYTNPITGKNKTNNSSPQNLCIFLRASKFFQCINSKLQNVEKPCYEILDKYSDKSQICKPKKI